MAEFHDCLDRVNSMKARRNINFSHWQQKAEVLWPTQAKFTTQKGEGNQLSNAIYDGTPRLAARDLATTVDGLIKPKSTTWFFLDIEDERLKEFYEVKRWLEVVQNYMWMAMYQKDARFIQRSCEVDASLVVIGHGALWIQENRKRNGMLYRSYHPSKFAIDENEEGIVDKIAIEENLTAQQAYNVYDSLRLEPPQKIKDALKDKKTRSNKQFEFAQLVLPNDDYDVRKIDVMNMAFASYTLDIANEKIVERSGFHEFPAAVPRWETSAGELYARAPGDMALPDANTLQAMGKTLLVGGQRAVDPPIWVQNDSIVSALRTFPGAVTILDTSDNANPIGTFPTSLNLPIGRDMQLDYRKQVEAAFFKNVFNLPIETRQMTATEIIERKEEFIRVIGPVFGRLETDYIGHTVERTFNVMERAGVFPPRPEVLMDQKITFRFKSPIQQARKTMEIAGLGQALNFLGPLAEIKPEIMDHFDGDAIVRDAPEWSGLPQRWIKPTDVVEAERAARAQAGQAQQALAESGPLTEAIKNVASAESMLTP